MWWNVLIAPVSSLISDVLKRVLPPEKMSEEERAKIEAEMTRALMSADMTRVEKEIEDRVSARELAAADVARGNAFTTVLAATHRPLWSLVVLGIFAFRLVAPYAGYPMYPLHDVEVDIMKTVIYFYFGGRTIEKVAAATQWFKSKRT